MLIHAAVIEWPSDFGEPPELVATADRDELHDLTRDKIAEMLAAVVPEVMRDFREAFTAEPDNFVDLIADADESVFVTYYQKEI